MLLRIDQTNKKVSRTDKLTLAQIGWNEKDLQELLYANLDKIFPDDELLLIMQSSPFQEEPDLMALDKEGSLNIFELKAWESKDFNLLQCLRYGQIYGQHNYKLLNEIYHRRISNDNQLIDALREKFNCELAEKDINLKQKFIVITNGVDYRTRQSINYWSTQGLNIQSWIYRIHKINEELAIEFDRFKIMDNPYEDINEGYYILNTNTQGGDEDEADMLKKGKAAAYYEPWKYKIENIKKGDKVFLYRSGRGIIAKGVASGIVEKLDYQGDPNEPEVEFSQKLAKFKILKSPISASEIKRLGETNYVFMQTLFAIDKYTGLIIIINF
jgi:hypothetical protein